MSNENSASSLGPSIASRGSEPTEAPTTPTASELVLAPR